MPFSLRNNKRIKYLNPKLLNSFEKLKVDNVQSLFAMFFCYYFNLDHRK